MKNIIIIALVLLIASSSAWAQYAKKDVDSLTRDDVLAMNIETLSDYDLDEIVKILDIVGASTIEELYELILNKDITAASKTEESLFDSPLSSTVLTAKEISCNGATSIEEALRLVPGIIVREKTNGNYDVQIRGGQNVPMNNMIYYSENTTTLIMIDGRPVFDYGMGGILWETLPVGLGDLDRIEVVRGPSSALYGPNAVNGVINLVTKSVDKETPLVAANVQSGSQNTTIGSFSLAHQLSNKFSASVSTHYEYRKRNTEELYIIFDDEYLSIDEYRDRAVQESWSSADVYDQFDNPGVAKAKYGINSQLNYTPNDQIDIHLSGGYNDSKVISSLLGDNPSSYATRYNYGYYTNLYTDIYGFALQASMAHSAQDYDMGHQGWKLDNHKYNFSLGYSFDFEKLKIAPEISYQSVWYDDRDYLKQVGKGVINDKCYLNNFAVSARFDYTPSDKTRLVAAIRNEKYNMPDRWTPSWQLIGSYKLNENNLLRAVYSRANQSTFIINSQTDFTWDLRGVGNSLDYAIFRGSDDPEMMTMDMFEIGYRIRPSKRLLLDIEAFYNKAKDYSALAPERMESVTFVDPSSGLNPLNGEFAVNSLYMNYLPLDIESHQYGISLSADMVLNEKMVIKSHLNFQKSTVNNFIDLTRDQLAGRQAAYVPGMIQDIQGYLTGITSELPKALYFSEDQPSEAEYKDDVENEALPSFWANLCFIYRPTKKWDISLQGYYFDKSYIYTQYDHDPLRLAVAQNRALDYTGNIDSKFMLNAKINYAVSKNIDLYLNGRNILNTESQEFNFMDKIGALYLIGLNIEI